MSTMLEDAMQEVRVTLDGERNPDKSRKFAEVISKNIFTDEATGNSVGVVIGETAEDKFGVSHEITIMLKEEEITSTIAVERTVAGIAAFGIKILG